jgi:uncharacterized membrane protein YfcA
MTEFAPFLLLSISVFAGALVSGLAGFAFSGVAGAILLHVLPPVDAVPLMMICSIAVQTSSLVILRHRIKWRNSLIFIAGGVIGIPPALYLLQHVDTWAFRVGFGIFLAIYSLYMLFRPTVAYLRQVTSRMHGVMIGFAGGLIGGLTAMPGALPTIWCDLQGMPKEQQRGVVQPYIAMMQLAALGLMLVHNGFPAKVLTNFTLSLPALAAGTTTGIMMFGRVNDAVFRRVVLGALFVAGLALVA